MRNYFLIVIFTLAGGVAHAQDNPDWLRYPAISPDGSAIVFTYKGDLYRVASDGGQARQLTFHEAHDFMPVWSRDGSRLAFASDRYGNFDIYMMDAEGGPAERITFHSADEYPYSFSHDDQSVLFGSVRQDTPEHRQFPTASQPELYRVPAGGGRVSQVFTIPAEYAQTSRDGSQILYHDKKGGENEWRKHHKSAITRDIWHYDIRTDEHRMLTNFEGENRQPVFTSEEDAFYYLSEESGSFNIHKLSLNGGGRSEQLTRFTKHPVRFLSYGGGTLAFGYDGNIYTMKEGEEAVKADISIRTQNISNPDRFITINGGVQQMDISPNGKEIAFIARGEVFVTSVDGSFTKRITNTPETEAFVSFTPDGNGVVYAGERDGKWSIYQTTKVRSEEPFFYASTLLKEEVLVSDEQDNYLPAFSPDGKKLAYIAGRRTFRVKDLETNEVKDLLTPVDLFHMRDGDKYFTWSPDSNWILFSWQKVLHNSEILLLAADGSKRVNLTESGYQDTAPKWTNNGRQMIWFTNRDGLRSYAASGRTERDVYTLFFNQKEWDLFNLSKDDYAHYQELKKARESEEDTDEEDQEKDGPEELTFDWERMKDQTARLTIHSGSISDAVLSKDGDKLYYLTQFDGNYNIWETDLRTRDTKTAVRVSGPGSLSWDKEMENLYLLSRGSIFKIDLNAGSSSAVTIAGEMKYDAEKEREMMFDHVYIRTKNIFYEPEFHGNDWDMLYDEYRKYVPHIGNSYEFAEMISEWLGELNVSHAGARYSRSIENPDQTASLGIFMDYNDGADGMKILEVIQGGPLDKADFGIVPGMIIEKIDGELVSAEHDAARYLNRKAGTYVLLDILDEDGSNSQQFTVKPITLAEERSLLYDRFIRINEREVDERSGGRLGYVHIPGMGDAPYRSVIQEMLGKYSDREGMIIDTRFNGGGDLVADLAMFFTGVKFNTYATADRAVGGEPTSRWTKPTISLINEAMYSDGHCYASAYSELGIGKTVGMPVPGTCSFAGWESLPDGTRWGVVPISARNKADEWMENNQTEPDIRVKNMPGVIDRNRDQQLERAIDEMMRDLDSEYGSTD